VIAKLDPLIFQRRFNPAATRMDAERSITSWRLWRKIAKEIKFGLKACFQKKGGFIDDCIKSLCERPRKRKLQGLPERVLELVAERPNLDVSRA
jgi:hypothetical protein